LVTAGAEEAMPVGLPQFAELRQASANFGLTEVFYLVTLTTDS